MDAALMTEMRSKDIQLAEGVELIYGANDQPLLFNIKSKKYIRISTLGVEVLDLLNRSYSIDDIITHLAEKNDKNLQDVERVVFSFFYQLRQSGAINLDPVQVGKLEKTFNGLYSRPMLRLPLLKTTNKIIHPFSYLLSKFSRRFLAILAFLTIILASIPLYILIGIVKLEFVSTPLNLWLITLGIFIHYIFHESHHAIVLKRFGIDIREAGIGLMYYFIPIAYVDTTDSYRLKRKFDRAAVSLAGPVFDITGAGISSLFVLYGSETVSAHFQVIMIIQLMIFIANLNPLLPTDGFHAIEAASGELNLRRRAFEFFVAIATFSELPASLINISRSRKTFYFIYGLINVLYICIILFFAYRYIQRF